MPSVADHLERWRAAGLLDEGQAERILAFERERAEADRREEGARPGVLEAVLYLGIAVAVVGVFTLTAQNWEELRTWARVGVLAVPGVLLLLAGAAMRAADEPAVERGSGAAWLASVALLAGATGVAGSEADWDGRAVTLVTGAVASGLALALWVARPSHLQVIGVAGGLVVLAAGAAQWVEDYETLVAGLLIAAFGALGIALTESGGFGPRLSARAIGAAGVMLGLIGAAYLDERRLWLELLVFVAGGALIPLGLRRSSFEYVVVAVIGLFIGLVAFIFRRFEDQLGAPLALLLSGTLLVAAALLLASVRGRLTRRAAS
jgi:uncharacterized membrane protein